jgi:hypothetical protein
MNNTYIYLRVKVLNIYMYRSKKIYKKKYNNRKATTYLLSNSVGGFVVAGGCSLSLGALY